VHCRGSHLHCSQGVDLNRVTQLQLSHHTRTLRAAGTLQGVPPSWCGRRVAEWPRRVGEPPIRAWRSGTTGKQPANLGVEGAEESLIISSDFIPTVRPPPKRS
jgi:hypothetical protein